MNKDTHQHAPMQARKLRRSVLKEELVALTGNATTAILLNEMIRNQCRARQFEKYIEEERARALSEGQEVVIHPMHGWFYKKASELSEESMLGVSEVSIRRYLKGFVEKGWVKQRENPYYKWDRTKQYRVDILAIDGDLQKIGYRLDGWIIEQMEKTTSEDPSYNTKARENELKAYKNNSKVCKTKSKLCKTKSKVQRNQNVGAIPSTSVTSGTITSHQQQVPEKQNQNVDKSTFDGGGGEDAHASNGNGDPLSELVESLYLLGTGLSRSIIRELATKNPDHARTWLKWWPKAAESRPEYWNNRKGSPAGALRLRLSDTARLPMQVISRNKAREAQLAAERAARQKKSKEAEKMAQNYQADRKRREKAQEVWKEYMCLAEPLRKQVDTTVAQRNPLLGQKLARFGGNVDRLDPRSLIYASFMEAAEGIMGEINASFDEGDWV